MKSSVGTNSIEAVVFHSVMFQREDDFYYFALEVVNFLLLVENSQTIIDVSVYRLRELLRDQAELKGHHLKVVCLTICFCYQLYDTFC